MGSNPAAPTSARPTWRRIPAWLPAALAGYIVVVFVPQVLNDGDTYMHLAAGDWILRHRAAPGVDPFSYTFAGAPWLAHEWLSELLMGIAFRLGGWSGVLVLFGAALALTLGLLAKHLARWLDPAPVVITLVIAASLISPSLLARPHLLALPLLELWTAGLLIARERGRVPWPMLPIMALWANLHGSFIFGLCLAVPFVLEPLLQASRRRAAGGWALFLACAAAAACATPWGWRGLLFPFQLLAMPQLAGIAEWQAPDFQALPPIELALMAVLYVCLSRGVRMSALRALILIAVLHLALQHSRHQMVAGVVGALVLAAPLGRVIGATPVRIRAGAGPIAGAFALAALATIGRAAAPLVRHDDAASPISALAHVPPGLAAMPVLNDYAFGGYLIFRSVRPFIDSRAELYGDAFLRAYGEMLRPDRAAIERTLQAHDVRWTIFPAGSPALAVMDALPGWRRLYTDAIAVVHVRAANTDPAN